MDLNERQKEYGNYKLQRHEKYILDTHNLSDSR